MLKCNVRGFQIINAIKLKLHCLKYLLDTFELKEINNDGYDEIVMSLK